jgi:hypothetical protein
MNNEDLNRILKSAPVPDPPEAFWEQFPKQVTSTLGRHQRIAGNTRASLTARPRWTSLLRHKPALSLGLCAVCAILLLVFFLHKPPASSISDPQLAAAQKYYREIESLFPNQLRAITFDNQGPHLNLADSPDVPASTPLYIKICGPDGCQRFITFSGQQVSLNGQPCEVLLDRQGHVLVVGSQLLWSGSTPTGKSGPYDVEARILANAS